ncbi:MAG: MBL fold metallo-hydrolase, partial [Firmicutes bacterium]|nr:MBL fold metallo-hydrolase [Bacillota bacterium]
ARLKARGLKLRYIILTHGHVDHIAALGEVREATGAEVLIHAADAEMLTDPTRNLSLFTGRRLRFSPAERLLADGDVVEVGTVCLEVIHTPGHTPGGICLKTDDVVITGDTLFAGSIGRSDFPGGNHGQLIRSIKERLLCLPGHTRVYPGHGPETTIEEEKRYNPVLT